MDLTFSVAGFHRTAFCEYVVSKGHRTIVFNRGTFPDLAFSDTDVNLLKRSSRFWKTAEYLRARSQFATACVELVPVLPTMKLRTLRAFNDSSDSSEATIERSGSATSLSHFLF